MTDEEYDHLVAAARAAANAARPAETLTEAPPKTAVCEHMWAYRTLGGFPIHVRACEICRAIDWFDIKQQIDELRWGEAVSTYADTGTFGLPVCTTAGRELGELRLDHDRARSLIVMLADAVTDAVEPYEPVERRSLDQHTDDTLDDLYDQLDTALETIVAYMLRTKPEIWARQASEIVNQRLVIGERNATIARVRHLADDMRRRSTPENGYAQLAGHFADQITAALDGTTPTETT
jgi:hypothetical protein